MISSEMIKTWKINYGLDKRTPEEAGRWWNEHMAGVAPYGAVTALGLCLEEIDSLKAENAALRRELERCLDMLPGDTETA